MTRYFTFIFSIFALISLVACGGTKSAQNQLLIGTWVSTKPYVVDEQGMQITFSNMSTTYSKNHTSAGSGDLSLSGGGLPIKLKLTIATKSTWQIKKSQLVENITDVDIAVKTKIPGLPNVGSIIAEQMESQTTLSDIIKLDTQTLILKENTTGLQITLKRR